VRKRPPAHEVLGTARELLTKKAASRGAEPLRRSMDEPLTGPGLIVADLVRQYRAEKLPTPVDTRRSYEVWLRNHILPRWGESSLTQLQAHPVELWLQSLDLAPKSKAHIRGLLSALWDFALRRGDVTMLRNPTELVTIRGASKRMTQPRSLTVEEFQKFTHHLEEPFRLDGKTKSFCSEWGERSCQLRRRPASIGRNGTYPLHASVFVCPSWPFAQRFETRIRILLFREVPDEPDIDRMLHARPVRAVHAVT